MTKQTEALKLAKKYIGRLVRGLQMDNTSEAAKLLETLDEALAEESSGTEQPAQYDYRIKYDRPCYKCGNNFCPGNCKEVYQEQPAIKQDLTPEQHQCNFPLCQNEEYQQALAEQIKRELYTGEPAQPQQEPDGWDTFDGCVTTRTSPPASKPLPLTDEEIEQVCVPLGAAMLSFTEVARAIEAKLREKNA